MRLPYSLLRRPSDLSKEPTVSIIVPVFNAQMTLERTLESIGRQTYAHYEVIIVDDGSTDASSEISLAAASRDSRIHFISLATNSGLPSVAKNYGAREAKGSFLAFLDADDIWMAHKLQRQVAALVKYPDVSLIHSSLLVFRRRKWSLRGILSVSRPSERLANSYTLRLQNRIQCSSVLVRTDVFRNLGGFDESPDLRVGEDWDLWLRASDQFTIGYIPELQGFYHQQATSVSTNTAPAETHAIMSKRHSGISEQPGRARLFLVHRLIHLPFTLWRYFVISPIGAALHRDPRILT